MLVFIKEALLQTFTWSQFSTTGFISQLSVSIFLNNVQLSIQSELDRSISEKES